MIRTRQRVASLGTSVRVTSRPRHPVQRQSARPNTNGLLTYARLDRNGEDPRTCSFSDGTAPVLIRQVRDSLARHADKPQVTAPTSGTGGAEQSDRGIRLAWGIGRIPRPGSRPAARPLLYLDIDGVLNPLSPDPDRFARHTIGELTVNVSAEHGAWLRALAGRYELVWATTWEHHANEHVGPLLGLPELPVVEFCAYRPQPGDPRFRIMQLLEMRKWAPILRHADGRPFAWIDDVIPMRIKRQALPYRGIKLIHVNPYEGITRHHVDRLLAWSPPCRHPP